MNCKKQSIELVKKERKQFKNLISKNKSIKKQNRKINKKDSKNRKNKIQQISIKSLQIMKKHKNHYLILSLNDITYYIIYKIIFIEFFISYLFFNQ